ncbi:LOW QUALITY PROTEIN: hypothetical protein PHMEG_00032134 [Phytophthora megakarya]|uniref:Uncharacterized protein n=1 Tax=Phytophthora megakarya TaxID=4795 RepID=A0A225UWC0_9STRA|nr:LOW QUALITY PROTEIN: hypothetical protein PHMEG_00032134 [Phytophthora megakarya]
MCHFCKKSIHIKADCFSVNKPSRETRIHVLNEGPAVAEQVTRSFRVANISLNVLCETPLIYKSRPLFSVPGEISVDDEKILTPSMLLDCEATAVYVSER